MSIEERTVELLTLPASERLSIAEALLESVHQGFPAMSEQKISALNGRRVRELQNGSAQCISWEEAKAALRRSLK